MTKAKQSTKSSQKELILKDIIAPKIKDYDFLFANLDLSSFSYRFFLQDYQESAIKSAMTALKLYVDNPKELYDSYRDYQAQIEKNLINTASFWMATGSGKSVVMIKLIALLHKIFAQNELPQKPIMLLVPNDKILEQFEGHISDYNAYQSKPLTLKTSKIMKA